MAVTAELLAASPVSDEHAAASPEGVGQGVYLLGRPTLRRFLRHVRHNAADPPDEGTLVEEWHGAHQLLRELERTEAGAADDARIVQMGPEYTPLLSELLRDPLIRHGFNTVPSEIALVDLERMVVYQKHIDVSFAAELERRLPPDPSIEDIFRLCLPYDHPQPPVRWSRMSDDRFVFVSPSNDLRFLGVLPLEMDDVDYPPPGTLVGVVGLAVGFGSNFLNALYAEKRLILRNGSHRAYMLYKRGIRWAPCIIQHVSARDELDVVGSSEVARRPDLYLRHPRPPMLRDYVHPELHKTMATTRRLRQVIVRFQVDEDSVPAL